MGASDPLDDTAPLADVFISYARDDARIAAALARTLEAEGFSVWWDADLYAGAEWETLLRRTLAGAKAVVVLWTPRSVTRPWVLQEADLALASGRLVPVVVRACTVPERFMARQAAVMDGWDGERAHPELERLLAGIAALAPPSRIDTVRPGYDELFLPFGIELPAVTGVADELRYLHFSVVMNPARRMAWYTAYNARPMHPDVQRGDRWQPDPALPAALQPQDGHYLGTGYDRGHLVAPSLVSWGSAREGQLANRQAFFWTNTAPQHPMLNQGWWWVVEDWERLLVRQRGPVTGFAGPAFAADDPSWGSAEQRIGRLRVRQNFRRPQAFWKVVCWTAGALQSAAFWWDQERLVAGVPEARRRHPHGQQLPPSTFRVTVSDVEGRTGLDFGARVRDAYALDAP